VIVLPSQARDKRRENSTKRLLSQVNELEMEGMLNEYDVNGDGVLSEEEFIMLLRCALPPPPLPACRHNVCRSMAHSRACVANRQVLVPP
jgi:hypothetical protein